MKNIIQLNRFKCFHKFLILSISVVLFCSFTVKGIQFNLNNEQIILRDTVPGKELNNINTESEYPGGKQAWMRYLIQHIRYPLSAMNNNIQGTIIVKFIIDDKGRLKQLDAISGAMELRQEAIRIIKESGRWIPAKENGKPIKSERQQTITFKWEFPAS